MTQLPTSVLGRSNLRVTRLGYGSGHRKPMDDSERATIHREIIESGINYIDTAGCYGNSEELIGRYLSSHRSKFFLATKCGCTSESVNPWTKKSMFEDLHRSLKRLKCDYVDVMQPHNPTVKECERNKVVETLLEMRDQGKVRWIGISTTLPDLPTFMSWDIFDVFQVPYSALEREHEDWITKAAESGIGIVIRGGVSLGEPGVGKGSVNMWNKFEEARLDELRETEESRTAFILRHTMSHPHSNTNIVGTTNPIHVMENLRAISKGPLSPEIYREAQRRLNEVGVIPVQIAT